MHGRSESVVHVVYTDFDDPDHTAALSASINAREGSILGGTNVPSGYRVCRGCGAHFRGSRKWFTLGTIFLLIAALEYGERIPLHVVVTTVAVGIGLIMLGRRKRWYHFNT